MVENNAKMSKEEIRKIRGDALLELTKTLGLDLGSKAGDIRKAITDRIFKNLHIGDDLAKIVKKSPRQTATILTCNMRTMNNKTTSINGVEFWDYCRRINAEAICLQDHKMSNHKAPIIEAAARGII